MPPKKIIWYSRNSITSGIYERFDFKILLEGFYLILGMAWFNQVELTLAIQSSVSVWTDKQLYLCCICCWMRIDSRYVYLRGQTVDVGSYGGYVNTHACSHKDGRMMEGLPHIQFNRPIFFFFFWLWNKEQHGGKTERTGKTRKMTAGRKSPQKNS